MTRRLELVEPVPRPRPFDRKLGVAPAVVQGDPGVTLLLPRPFVQTAAGEAHQRTLQKLVGEAPIPVTLGGHAPVGPDLQHVAAGRGNHPREQRPGRQPDREDDVWTEATDGRDGIETDYAVP